MNLLDNFETLQERINTKKDIEETVEEFVDAVNEATDEGYIEYDSKGEICDILGRIQEAYAYDQDDSSIEDDMESLKNIIEII